MKKRRLGRSNLEVSAIGMGGIPLAVVSRKGAIRILRRSIELGINFYDTARCYGVSEERLGEGIKGYRDQCCLVTKSTNLSKSGILKDVDLSLRKLKTDRIDVYQLHGVTRATLKQALGDALDGLHEAKKNGKILHIGITSHDCRLLVEVIKTGVFSTIEVPFNFVESEPQKELMPLSEKLDVGLIFMKPLGGGIFANPGISLRYVLQYRVGIPIPGMANIRELEENVAAAEELRPLSTEEEDWLRAEAEELGSTFCRRCGYCSPCPQGVPIQNLLLTEICLKREGLDYLVRVREYDRIMKLAKNCVDCRRCVSKCPYQLPIPELIREIVSKYEPLIMTYSKKPSIRTVHLAKKMIKSLILWK